MKNKTVGWPSLEAEPESWQSGGVGVIGSERVSKHEKILRYWV